MDKQELKPCPFCGGEGHIKLRFIGTEDTDVFLEEYAAVCINCGATTGQRYSGRFRRRDGVFQMLSDGYEAAVAGWNRRAYEPGAPGPAPEDSGGTE